MTRGTLPQDLQKYIKIPIEKLNLVPGANKTDHYPPELQMPKSFSNNAPLEHFSIKIKNRQKTCQVPLGT